MGDITMDKQSSDKLRSGDLVTLPGGRVAQWESTPEKGSSFRNEHFRTVDSLGLLLRNGAITKPMHEAGQEFSKNFVIAQLDARGSVSLQHISGGQALGTMTERVAWARKRLGQALDAVGGITSPAGCALWQVAGLGKSVKEWSATEGWNGRTLNVYEAKGVLVAALGALAVHYGYLQ
jgi:hypothetical protein